MNSLKIPNFLKCSVQRAYTGVQLHNRALTKCAVNCNKEGTAEIRRADHYFSHLIRSKCKQGSLYAGTGQYFSVPDHEWLILLNFEEDFLKEKDATLFDAIEVAKLGVHGEHVDLLKTIVTESSVYSLYEGEVDAIDVSQWQHGFIVKPFSIFSGDERIVYFTTDENDTSVVYTSVHGAAEILPVSAIEYVGVYVSPEPYNERNLILGLHEPTNEKQSKIKTLISVQKNEVSCDLGKLTIETEWLMKAAALLCKKCQSLGNKDCHLQVSEVLQPENNVYVEMRQEKWKELLQKHTDI